MHATIRIYNQPDVADDLAAHADEIQQLMAQVEGLQWYCLFRTESGCASVSVCANEQAGEASTDAAAAWFRGRTGEVTDPDPMIARGDVIASVVGTNVAPAH